MHGDHRRAEVGIGRIRDRLAYEFIELKASLVYERWSGLGWGRLLRG